ncbi:MAG: hypothetical protein ACFFB3_06410, partial [Candidatus Hodarchaeota archaeon]
MKEGIKEFQFDSKAEEILATFLGKIWKALTDVRVAPEEARGITGELQEHILQAYWKETDSNIVKEASLKEILVAMGDPREIASEYLLDWRDAEEKGTRTAANQTIRLNSGIMTSSSQQTRPRFFFSSLDDFLRQRANFLLLTLPLALVISLYGILLLSFSLLKDAWIALIVLSDTILLIPLFWYQFRWKQSSELNKLSSTSPRRFRSYFIAVILLLIVGGLILPFLRVEGVLYRSNNPPYWGKLTLEGDREWLGGGFYRYEYWIEERFIILVN